MAWFSSSWFRETMTPTREPVAENRLDTESTTTTFSAASWNSSMEEIFCPP